jgi:hypothetical protein
VGICEDFTTGTTSGTPGIHPGTFTEEGWLVSDFDSQLLWDLGQHYVRGSMEVEVKGPVIIVNDGDTKKPFVSLWNTEIGRNCDEDRGEGDITAFYQWRFQAEGMMLRLTNRPGGSSHEGLNTNLELSEEDWHVVTGVFDTQGGTNALYLDGQLVNQGTFNAPFDGLRYVWIGTDNYFRGCDDGGMPNPGWGAIEGLTYRNFKVYDLE